MNCHSLDDCFEQIGAYTNGAGTGYPLLVHVETFNDYQEIVQRMAADQAKQCVFVSSYTSGNGLPDIQCAIDAIRGEGSYALFGLSQSLMLQSPDALDRQIDELLGCSIRGHAIVLLSHCRPMLEKYPKIYRAIVPASQIIIYLSFGVSHSPPNDIIQER